MGQVLTFNKKLASITVRDGRRHCITVEILDRRNPRKTRWSVQFDIQEESGYSALSGFTDAAVAAGHRHKFYVRSSAAVRRFIAANTLLVTEGKVAIWVDGRLVRPALNRAA